MGGGGGGEGLAKGGGLGEGVSGELHEARIQVEYLKVGCQ